MAEHPVDDTGAADAVSPDAPSPGPRRSAPLRVEAAWEACNQVGGIYTVLRSKAEVMSARWGHRYCLIGPWNQKSAQIEFEAAPMTGVFGRAAQRMIDAGFEVAFGRWLIPGRPRIVLLHLDPHRATLGDVKYRLWADHNIPGNVPDPLVDDVLCFGEAMRMYLEILADEQRRTVEGGAPPGAVPFAHPHLDALDGADVPADAAYPETEPDGGSDAAGAAGPRVVAQVHEWMAAACVPMLRHNHWPGSLIFTTHATILGRYLAMNNPAFYDHLAFFNPAEEARHYNIETQHGIERAAAHGAQVFTTVSAITALECRHLLGREVDVLLPNGLNINRFDVKHEFQHLHDQAKSRIHEFTTAHFFPSYSFDLDRTLYFFTSGRYEYRNKGMDLTLEALARLNHRLKESGSDVTVVFFIVTRAATRSITVDALQSMSMLQDFRKICGKIQDDVGQALFSAATRGEYPDLNSLVDEYWRLRLRRNQQAWKRDRLPAVVTHDMIDSDRDPVLEKLRSCNLLNHAADRVKVVFHPDFINATSPLFGLDYDQFVRGCHLGVFPSYYEPWGYTPLESIAAGVPAVTSDLSGFGAYVESELPDTRPDGVYVTHRRDRHPDASADELAQQMFDFCQLNRRARIAQRNAVEDFATNFAWRSLIDPYLAAHDLALERMPSA